MPRSEGLIVAGDLNSHIGSNRDGYEDVMGHYGFGGQNTESGTVLDFCRNHKQQILDFCRRRIEKSILRIRMEGQRLKSI